MIQCIWMRGEDAAVPHGTRSSIVSGEMGSVLSGDG
jgi:hypothetical protein